MSTKQAIDDLVERFIDDVSDIVRRVQNESLATALRAIQSGRPVELPALVGARTKKAAKALAAPPRGAAKARKAQAASSTSKRRAASAPAEATSEASGAAEHTNGQPASVARSESTLQRLRSRKLHLERRSQPAIPPAPASDPATREEAPSSDRSQTSAEREAMVLDAVRFLVRGTAAQIAQRCGLPNGTVYVVLRALVTSGKVAKTETARGVEYGLVSTGGIRPFKRVSAGTSTPPPPPAAETAESSANGADEKHDEANGASVAHSMTNGASTSSEAVEAVRWIEPA